MLSPQEREAFEALAAATGEPHTTEYSDVPHESLRTVAVEIADHPVRVGEWFQMVGIMAQHAPEFITHPRLSTPYVCALVRAAAYTHDLQSPEAMRQRIVEDPPLSGSMKDWEYVTDYPVTWDDVLAAIEKYITVLEELWHTEWAGS